MSDNGNRTGIGQTQHNDHDAQAAAAMSHRQRQLAVGILTVLVGQPVEVVGPALLHAAVVLAKQMPRPITSAEFAADCARLFDGIEVTRDSGLVVPGVPG